MYMNVFLHVYMHTKWMSVSMEARRGYQISWYWSYRFCELPCGCWELNSGPCKSIQWFNYWAISLAPTMFIKENWNQKKKNKFFTWRVSHGMRSHDILVVEGGGLHPFKPSVFQASLWRLLLEGFFASEETAGFRISSAFNVFTLCLCLLHLTPVHSPGSFKFHRKAMDDRIIMRKS